MPDISQSPQNILLTQEDIKVFICGQDVSKYIKSVKISLSMLHLNGNACTIVGENPNRLFTMSYNNLKGNFLKSESIKQKIYEDKSQLKTTYDYAKKIEDAISRARAQGRTTGDVEFTYIPEEQSDSQFYERFSLNAGNLVFGVGDPVRIFIKHPYKYNVANMKKQEVWKYGFSGYITATNQVDLLAKSAYTFSLSCVGAASKLLALSRVTKGISYYLDVIEEDDMALLDMINGSGWTNMFAQLTLPQLLRTLVLGYNPTEDTDMAGLAISAEDQKTKPIAGIGRYTKGEIVKFNDPSFKLDTWHKNLNPDLTIEEVTSIGEKSGIDLNATEASRGKSFGGYAGETGPDTGKLYILLPDESLQDYKQIVNSSVQSTVSMQSEVTTRLDIIKEIVAGNAYYHCYETGKGDIVCEFPMYDFTPSDFGEIQPILEVTDKKTSAIASMTLSENDAKVATWVQATGDLTAFNTQVDNTTKMVVDTLTSITVLPNLIAKYGIRQVSINVPFIKNDKEGIRYIGKVLAAKILSQVRSASLNLELLLLDLLPNRPFYNSEGNYIGLIMGYDYNISYPQSSTTSLNVDYVRMASIDNNGQLQFMAIGGVLHNPLNYGRMSNLEIPQSTTYTSEEKANMDRLYSESQQVPIENIPVEDTAVASTEYTSEEQKIMERLYQESQSIEEA